MANEFAVEMQDIVKQFITPEGGILAAVNHVTMQIKDGEFFSLLGPSGCGKTTSLRMIAGFELPTDGKIFIRGKEMSQVPAFQRPINTVFQQYALFPHMTVEQNIGFGLIALAPVCLGTSIYFKSQKNKNYKKAIAKYNQLYN